VRTRKFFNWIMCMTNKQYPNKSLHVTFSALKMIYFWLRNSWEGRTVAGKCCIPCKRQRQKVLRKPFRLLMSDDASECVCPKVWEGVCVFPHPLPLLPVGACVCVSPWVLARTWAQAEEQTKMFSCLGLSTDLSNLPHPLFAPLFRVCVCLCVCKSILLN